MSDSIARRMAQAVRWGASDIRETVNTAERACFSLSRRGMPVSELLETAVEENVYAALLLARRLFRRGFLSQEKADEIWEQMGRQCEHLLNGMEEVCRKQIPDGTQETCSGDLEDISRICVTALVLDRDSLVRQILAAAWKSVQDFKTRGLDFSRRLFELLMVEEQDTLSYQARLYLLLYESYPYDWNQHIIYHRGMELPVGDTVPAPLGQLIRRCLEDRHFRYLDNLLKVFIHTRLSCISISVEEVMEAAFDTEEIELFRGLLFCEKELAEETGDAEGSLKHWWSMVQQKQREENCCWQELKDWFIMYYVSRRIFYAPEKTEEILSEYPKLPPQTGQSLQKTTSVQQETLCRLFEEDGRKILSYLEWLGDYNVFRFRPEEEYYPYFYPEIRFDMEKYFRHQKELGRSTEEMIFLYMNTFARSCYNIRYFFRILFEDRLELRDRHNLIDVREWFASYPLSGTVTEKDGKIGVSVINICTGKAYLPLPADWVLQNKAYCDTALTKGRRLTCYLYRVNAANYFSYVLPYLEEENRKTAAKTANENFRQLCALLSQIISSGELSTEMNHTITGLSLPQILEENQRQELDLKLVQCCAALISTPGSARYFINMINRKDGSRYNRYRYPYQLGKKIKTQYIPRELFTAGRECWRQIKAARPPLEELFFVYINTALKMCVSLGELMDIYYHERTDIVSLTGLMSEHTAYWFMGRLERICSGEEEKSGTGYGSLRPLEFSSGPAGRQETYRFLIGKGEEAAYHENQNYQFRIGAYDCRNHVFVVDEVSYQSDYRRTAPKHVFLKAMGQAAVSIELEKMTIDDLQADIPKLELKDTVKLISPMLQALLLRLGSEEQMRSYLSLIAKNNPWKFSQAAVPFDTDISTCLKNRSWTYQARNLADRLIECCDMKTVLFLYFHTPLRSALSLNQLLQQCRAAGKALLALPHWMAEYPLLLKMGEKGYEPVNFYADAFQLECAPPEPLGMLTVMLQSYDEDEKKLILAVCKQQEVL